MKWQRIADHLIATGSDGSRWTIKMGRGVMCKLMQNGANLHLPFSGFYTTVREAKRIAKKLDSRNG